MFLVITFRVIRNSQISSQEEIFHKELIGAAKVGFYFGKRSNILNFLAPYIKFLLFTQVILESCLLNGFPNENIPVGYRSEPTYGPVADIVKNKLLTGLNKAEAVVEIK